MSKETKQKIMSAIVMGIVVIGAIQLNNRVIEPMIAKASTPKAGG